MYTDKHDDSLKMKQLNQYINEKLILKKNLGLEYVDLGLPSGTLWATKNLGAKDENDTGDYFAWGETEPKKEFYADDKSNKFANTFNTVSYSREYEKYNKVDGLKYLDPVDDAANVILGKNWYIPTKDQIEELLDNCNIERNGNSMFCLTSKINDQKIYFKCSGWKKEGDTHYSDSKVAFYSNTLSSDNFGHAWICAFPDLRGKNLMPCARYVGATIRPVKNK